MPVAAIARHDDPAIAQRLKRRKAAEFLSMSSDGRYGGADVQQAGMPSGGTGVRQVLG
jgi:hypothetical protein